MANNIRKRRTKLHVRSLRHLKHPQTGEPFLYIYMRKDGWFLVSQLASHVFGVTLDCLLLRIRCAVSQLTSNKRKYMRFSRCTTIYDPVILEQIRSSGVSDQTIRKSRMVVDMHTTRLLMRSFDDATQGRMLCLFEAILDLCFGPPDGLFHSRMDRNPLDNTCSTPVIYCDDQRHFQCDCGKNYQVLGGKELVKEKTFDRDSDLIMGTPRRKRRRTTRITPTEKLKILSIYNYKCATCSTSIGTCLDKNKGIIIPYEVDHKLERSRGGSNATNINLQPLCLNCHQRKTFLNTQSPFEPFIHS